jgi:hypothetical protein
MTAKKIISTFLLTVLVSFAFSQRILKVDTDGIKLRQFYLNQNVENLWPAGQHVNWETGEPDNPNATKGIKTHCSAFVASVCKQKGIYILRPPEHKTGLLANAQFDWLFSGDAFKKGWRQIKDSMYDKAQELANIGLVVVAVYKNPNPEKPGHIALVMPVEKSTGDLYKEGPTLIQAGRINKNYISLKDGFKNHISDWTLVTQEIMFFYNKGVKD